MYAPRQNKKAISRQIDVGFDKIRHMSQNKKNGGLIQCYMGRKKGEEKFVCSCDSVITYKIIGKGGSAEQSKGSGGNDRNTISDVLSIFQKHGLVSLFTIPQQDNEPGKCAEPHAVADALEKIPQKANVLSIQVSQARTADNKLKKRCETCKQWVPGNKVKKYYLVQKF